MDKVILVMDDPMYCCNCPLAKSKRHNITKEEIWLCGIAQKDKYDYSFNPIDMESDTKPNWCPLRPVPNKQYEGGAWTAEGYVEDGFPSGWNACIEEILCE